MSWLNRLLTPRAATPENPRFSLNDPGAWEAFDAGTPSAAGLPINRKSALTLPAFWRGVNLICTNFAKIPEIVYRRVDGGAGKVVDTKHFAYGLLRYQPIPTRIETTAFDQKRVKMAHVLLKGNGYRYIFRNGDGTPRELLLLDPDVTQPVRVDGQVWYITKVGGQERKLPSEDVLHWRGLGWDGLVGYDVLTFAREALGEGLAKQKYSAGFFGRGARPGVVIKTKNSLVDKAKSELLKGFDRMHSGLDNAHRAGILDGGAEIQQLSIDAEKAQLIESRQFSIVDMANILGLPPHKLGDKDGRSFASLEQEDQNFLDDCLDGWFCMVEAEHREKLLTEEQKTEDSHVIEFHRESLVKADLAAQSNYFRTALGGRPWMLPDEAREKMNMNPLGGEAAEYLNPLNMGKGGQDNQPDDKGGPQPGNPKNNT
jgi:HK97 family phage portal protein